MLEWSAGVLCKLECQDYRSAGSCACKGVKTTGLASRAYPIKAVYHFTGQERVVVDAGAGEKWLRPGEGQRSSG